MQKSKYITFALLQVQGGVPITVGVNILSVIICLQIGIEVIFHFTLPCLPGHILIGSSSFTYWKNFSKIREIFFNVVIKIENHGNSGIFHFFR